MSSPAAKLHFLLLPLPEQGHVNPMLSLASRLAVLGCTVTFVRAEKAPSVVQIDARLETASVEKEALAGKQALQEANYAPVSTHEETSVNGMPPPPLQDPNDKHVNAHNGSRAAQHCVHEASHDASTHASVHLDGNIMPLASDGTNIEFWRLPHVRGLSPPPQGSSRFEILKHTLASLEERQAVVEKLVQESKSSDAPISCIICDIFLCSWVMTLAKRQAIPAATLVPCCGVNFYMPYLALCGKSEESEKLQQCFGFAKRKGPANPGEMKKMEEIRSNFKRTVEGVEMTSHVLVNSFEQLESALLESLKTSELNFKFIGPCLPAWEAEDTVGKVDNIMAKQAGCIFTQDGACLQWLDQQEKGSVLFVSFGSEVSPEEEQVQELALGIEGSGHKYLWVVRPDAPSYNWPQEDFRKRTSNLGIFVSWVPQRQVLQHSAVGGFLTHCGWNSTLESIMFGVPMICLPLNGDQFLNAHLIDAHWKVGLRIGPPRTLVPRAQVERVVQDVMSSNDLRERIALLKEAASCAIFDSQISINSFVQDIANK